MHSYFDIPPSGELLPQAPFTDSDNIDFITNYEAELEDGGECVWDFRQSIETKEWWVNICVYPPNCFEKDPYKSLESLLLLVPQSLIDALKLNRKQ